MTNPVETLWTNVVTPQLADLSMAVLHLLWQQNAAARATEVSKRRYAARLARRRPRCSAATRRASRHLHATCRRRGDRHAGCGPHGLPALPLRGFRTELHGTASWLGAHSDASETPAPGESIARTILRIGTPTGGSMILQDHPATAEAHVGNP